MKPNLFLGSIYRNGTAVSRVLGLCLVALLMTGCPASKPTAEVPPADAGKEKDKDKLVIRGSNTFGEELAPRLISEYKKDHPAINFDVESKATVYGMAALLGGKCDIAGASRTALKDELELAKMRGVELNEALIGSYTVAVVANAATTVTNLTKDQVREIFSGEITNWVAVGGPDAPITLYIRDPISGTSLGFKELAIGGTGSYGPGPKTFTSYEQIADAVAKDPHGIGYTSFELIKHTGLKGVSIEGIEPTVATVNKGEYPYARAIRLYTRKGSESATAHEFIQFVQSERGQKIVAEMGFAPRM